MTGDIEIQTQDAFHQIHKKKKKTKMSLKMKLKLFESCRDLTLKLL